MTDPRHISINDYTYDLPLQLIALHPLPERDLSKLLIYDKGEVKEDIYRNISSHLPPGSLAIFNNTRVIAARIVFQKASGGSIEIFCLEPAVPADIQLAMLQQKKVQWQCLVGGASKWKHGQVLEKKMITNSGEQTLQAKYIEKRTGYFIIEFSWQPDPLSFAEILQTAGAIPLPPYIKRKVSEDDKTRYQTIYAEHEGSVAAPTAGLHFTPRIFDDLRSNNIEYDHITLHVGAGTFKPVKADTMHAHEMHAEVAEVNIEVIKNIIAHLDKKIIAVGTTSLRTIESLYWIGHQLLSKNSSTSTVRSEPSIAITPQPELFYLTQWEAYDKIASKISVEHSLSAITDHLNKHSLQSIKLKTQILIAPGYEFKIVNGLVTNFHQPNSTLLLLVASFIGEEWHKVYDHALKNNFRFLSYGDGCLLWKVDNTRNLKN